MTCTLVRLVMSAALALALGTATANAEEASTALRPLSRPALDRAVRQGVAEGSMRLGQSGATPGKRKDSILNGALIGAAIGGVGGSALIVAAHGGSDSIPRAMMNVAALPTLAGLAAGAIVDALR